MGIGLGSIVSGVVKGFTNGPLGVVEGLAGALGQADANAANSSAAQKQMDFQQYNSDTAIQRRVKDLIAAGLNPMLAYNDAASTPSGAMSVSSSIAQGDADYSMKSAQSQSSAASAKQAIAQTENIKTQSDLNKSLEVKAGADTLNSTASAANQSAQAAKARVEAARIAAETTKVKGDPRFWLGSGVDKSSGIQVKKGSDLDFYLNRNKE